jgi:glycerol-3-phosphate dehydrogenase
MINFATKSPLILALFITACHFKDEKNDNAVKIETFMIHKEMKSLKRDELLMKINRDRFDILIIGGGATGAGAALDSASRGLKTALIEAQDFSFGTSSRSTKLVHGGVRYLENAVKHFDYQEYTLVRDALAERKRFLENASHLACPLPLITPVYGWFEAFYYLMGLKLYDMISGTETLGQSRFISQKKALELFPLLKKDNLKGAVLYYDGQFDDARMNISLILSAIREGAIALNYVKAKTLIKENGSVVGVKVRDMLTQEEWPIYAKVVINATGSFADKIRKMDNENATDLIEASQGSHLLLPESFSSPKSGLVIPKTKDGRVLFLLPWQGKTLAGTTDHPEQTKDNPKVTKEEVDYILAHISQYFSIPLKKSDIVATFSGLRPLVKPKEAIKTASISRDHMIEVTPSKLVTIVGGKWTTYRKMAQDVVDIAVKTGDLSPNNPSKTKDLKLVGAKFYKESLADELLAQNIEPDIAKHLAQSYGDQAFLVLEIKKPERLLKGYPYILAEVIYAVRYEYAQHAIDVLARRMRLAFLDTHAARISLPTVVSLMAKELLWDHARVNEELKMGEEYLAQSY